MKKTNITQYFERVPADKLTGSEIYLWGEWLKAPKTGTTDVIMNDNTFYKYDFAKQEVILVDAQGGRVWSKKVDLKQFIPKQYQWLRLIKQEARLALNLDEEEGDEPAGTGFILRKYVGYIDKDGDFMDMRSANEDGDGAQISSFAALDEEGVPYAMEDNGDVYQLFEAKLAKDSNPQEGFVYWDKKHETAFYVVAVYPKAKEKQQVSYWSDEGVRKTCAIEWFKSNMVPSSDVDDYEIFEECEVVEDFDEMNEEEVCEELTATVSAVNGSMLTLLINGKKYSYKPEGMTPKEMKEKFDGMAKHNIGRALAWVKKNATTKDSYKTV